MSIDLVSLRRYIKQRSAMYCEKCNVEFHEGLRYCKWCGQRLIKPNRATSELQWCEKCRAPVQPTWVYCKACGASIAGSGASDQEKSSDTSGLLCVSCQSKNPSDSLVCESCGALLVTRPETGSPTVRGMSRPADTVRDLSDPIDIINAEPEPAELSSPLTENGPARVAYIPTNQSNPEDGEKAPRELGALEVPDPRKTLGGARGFETNVLKHDEVLRATSVIKGKRTGPVEEEESLRSDDSEPAERGASEVVLPHVASTLDLASSAALPIVPPIEVPVAPTMHEASPPESSPPESSPAPPNTSLPEQTGISASKSSTSSPKTLIVSALAVLILVLIGAGGVLGWKLYTRHRDQIDKTGAAATSQTDLRRDSDEAVTQAKGTEDHASNIPPGMVFVAGGAYKIGRDDGDPLARPAHMMQLEAFYIDQTEVTNAEYRKFIVATGHSAPSGWSEGRYPSGHDNRPVCDVSCRDAEEYAAWAGKRLPSEAEWEAAARGADGRIYPWGNEWKPGLANIGAKIGERQIQDVGQYKSGASPAGAFDMIGNVWEWTKDVFSLYPNSKAVIPSALKEPERYRIIRGGAFDGDQANDASYRGYVEADRGYDKTGFRCAKSVAIPK